MGQDYNYVLADAQGRVCNAMNIVLRGTDGDGSSSVKSGPVSVNFIKRILKCKLTEIRTHDILPHLVKRRKTKALNERGKRLRLDRVIRFDANCHLNKSKKWKGIVPLEKKEEDEDVCLERESAKEMLRELFKTKDENEEIRISRVELMKFVDEYKGTKKRKRSANNSSDDNDQENMQIRSNSNKFEGEAVMAEIDDGSGAIVDTVQNL